MNYMEIKNHKADLKTILENCRFFVVRKQTHLHSSKETSTPYKLEDFERLKILKLTIISELEKEV